MSKLEVKKCVGEIIDTLCDRGGFSYWWYNLDDDTEKEIEKELESIIERRLNNVNKEEIIEIFKKDDFKEILEELRKEYK